jgi:hypothetical protein
MRAVALFVSVAAGVGGLAMVAAPDKVSDAVGLTPDDRVALALRVGGALVLLGAVVGGWQALR